MILEVFSNLNDSMILKGGRNYFLAYMRPVPYLLLKLA